MTQTTFALTNDDKERKYYKMFGSQSTCVSSIGDKNIEYVGIPKFNIRTGNSTFGDEFFVEFQVKSVANEYKSNSSYDTIEIYLDIKEAKKMFNTLFMFFEKLKEEDEK